MRVCYTFTWSYKQRLDQEMRVLNDLLKYPGGHPSEYTIYHWSGTTMT